MDGGPFRGSTRPAARSTANRPEAEHRSSEAPKATREDVQYVSRTAPQYDSKDSSMFKRVILPILIGLIVAGAVIGSWFAWTSLKGGGATAIDADKYQAVLLTNGESYFGKLTALNDDFMRLTDVYYLKPQSDGKDSSENSQQKTTSDSSFQLIKFGGEVQGPEDEIIIAKKQMVYYENLKSDGKATQAIKQYKETN